MNQYEIMYILKPPDSDEVAHASAARYNSLITDNGGNVEKTDYWGKKRLAYEMKDLNEGYYVLITFSGNAKCVNELDRVLRIDENVLRHLIIRKWVD